MRRFPTLLVLLLSLTTPLLARERVVVPPGHPTRVAPADWHSYARPAAVRVRHVTLDLEVDFERRILEGSVVLHLDRIDQSAPLTLDLDGPVVERVSDADSGEALAHSLAPRNQILGTKMEITLAPSTRAVRIDYATTPAAGGLHWMSPAQTSGGIFPFLYSQNEPIDARTWIPLQDSPSIRVTYDATIRVPEGYLALMSAENPQELATDGVYTFRMRTPIPPYLIALAVSVLEFRATSPTTGIYAEPHLANAAQYEMAEVGQMIAAAEAVAGPYRWGRYDAVFMPPTYHVSGMEHPRLNFISPYILTGDRTLLTLIAHELAHSWAGNTVTTATWNDVWLNEGITTYLERRIMETVYGRDFSEMLAWNGVQGAIATVNAMAPTAPASRLHRDFTGRDPGEAFSTVAYEKGYTFLRTLEDHLGRERLDDFLQSYFSRYALDWMDAGGFRGALLAHLEAEPELVPTLHLDEWLFESGMPGNLIDFESERFRAVDAEIGAFASGRPASSLAFHSWSPYEYARFLAGAPAATIRARMSELDAAMSLTAKSNLRIASPWLQHVVNARYSAAYDELETFLLTSASSSTIRALYTTMSRLTDQKPRALSIYQQARPRYHPFTQNALDNILGFGAKAGKADEVATERWTWWTLWTQSKQANVDGATVSTLSTMSTPSTTPPTLLLQEKTFTSDWGHPRTPPSPADVR